MHFRHQGQLETLSLRPSTLKANCLIVIEASDGSDAEFLVIDISELANPGRQRS